MEVTWSIAQLERNTADGGVTIAHWRADATETVGENKFFASSYGTCGFTPDAEAEGFVPFENLTEEQVLNWCFTTLKDTGYPIHSDMPEELPTKVPLVNKDMVEEELATRIEKQKAPKTATGMPW